MKKYTKIVLAGGSGQIGTALCRHFKDITETITILSRAPEQQHGNVRKVNWDGKTTGAWTKELDGADVLINLTGKNVNCRYNLKNREEIISSRVQSIQALSSAILKCIVPPKLFVQCTSATIYRHAEDRPMDETTGEIGDDFSTNVCKKWEQTFWDETSQLLNIRKVVLRISLVLSPNEGVLPRLKNLVNFGLGGRQGNGRQMVSWIHEKDVAQIVEWMTIHPELEGIFNCTSPFPVNNTNMMRIIRESFGKSIGLPTPKLLLKAGAFLIGTETELILKSRWVLPEKIVASGYHFKFPKMADAVKDILSGR